MNFVYQNNGNINNPAQATNPFNAHNVEVVEIAHPIVDEFAAGLSERVAQRVGDAISLFNKDKEEKVTTDNVDEVYPFTGDDEPNLLESFCNVLEKLFGISEKPTSNKEMMDTLEIIAEANPNFGKKCFGILNEAGLNAKAEQEGITDYKPMRTMVFGLG